MKQSKRFLCVLMSMLMIFSCFTVGASAYKTSYTSPAGYDDVLKPYFTAEQAASALLDYLDDEVLAGINVDEDISALSVHIHIYSIDSLFDSVRNIFESTVYKAASSLFNLGDVEKLNVSIPKNTSIRRRSTTMSDLQFLGYVLQWLQVNSDRLYKWADNTFDLGLIDNFWDPREELTMLNDLHGYINEMLYGILINPDKLKDDGSAFVGSSVTLDSIIQDFINNRCVKFIVDMLASSDGSNAAAEFLGLETDKAGKLVNQAGLLDLCPSLKASDIDITKVSTYDLIKNLFGALIDDIVVKYAGQLILDALKIKADDVNADTSYIDIAITLFVTAESMGLPEDADTASVVAAFLESQGVPNPEKPLPLDKTNATVKYILGDGITQYIYFEDDGQGGTYLTLAPDFVAQLSNYIKMLLPMLSSFVSGVNDLTDEQSEALELMNDEQTFAFALQYILENFVSGVKFSKNCNTIKELATYSLVNVAAELIPNIDYDRMIERGELDPNSDQCLDIAANIGVYYLNGEFGMNAPYGISFSEMLNYAFDFFAAKYEKLFNIYPTDSAYNTYKNNIWYKLYMSVNQWIPLTNICYGVENSWYGMQELIQEKIIGSVLDFDIPGLLSIFGHRVDSDLQKPLTKVLVNLVARILNGLFQLPNESSSNKTSNADQLKLIIPYSYGTLDNLTTNVISTSGPNNGCGLKNTVRMLLANLTNITGANSLMSKSLPVVTQLMGILKNKDYDYIKLDYRDNNPSGTTYSIAQLKGLYDEVAAADNEGLKYYEDAYDYFHMVDFAPWAYLGFRSIRGDAKDVIDRYEAARNDPQTFEFPTREEITYAYYALNNYQQVLLDSQTTADNYQLLKIFNEVKSAGYTNTNPDGSAKYTVRTWNAYTHAINFAQKVLNEYSAAESADDLKNYRQSKINRARSELIDAIEALKAYIDLADYSSLDIAINNVLNIESDTNMFTKSSVQAVIDAYRKAVATDRDYDMDDQKIVDNAYEALRDAIDALKFDSYIELYDTVSQYTDETNKYIFGLGENYFSKQDAMDWDNDFDLFFSIFGGSASLNDDYTAESYFIDLEPTHLGNGTGSKIQIKIGDRYDETSKKTTLKEYTVIVLGDINGDGFVDGQDTVIMRAYAAMLLDTELSAKYTKTVCDLDNDGTISSKDAALVENHGVGKGDEIDQCPEYVISDNKTTFSDLVA